jgi:hypothetical protein
VFVLVSRVATTVYVFVVVPFSAVTTMFIVFAPTDNDCDVPLVLLKVCTDSAFIPVTVIAVIVYGTVAVYDVVLALKLGVSVPALTIKSPKSTFALVSRVTTTVYVFVVPFSAVTAMLIVFAPTDNDCATPLLPLKVCADSALVPVTVIAVTTFATVAVYDVVPALKLGVSVPALTINPLKFAFALALAARVTTTVYVFVVLFSAVTTMVIVLLPVDNGCDVPLLPLKVCVVGSAPVPVTVIAVTEYGTATVYDVVPALKLGVSVPALTVKLLKSTFAARVTVTVYVFVVVPFSAVTAMSIVFSPTNNDRTATPLLGLKVCINSAPVPVTVIAVTECATATVYDVIPALKLGVSVP